MKMFMKILPTRRIVYRHCSQLVRQNFNPKCEEAINKQIKEELEASYAYMAMVSASRIAEMHTSNTSNYIQSTYLLLCYFCYSCYFCRLITLTAAMSPRPASFASLRRPVSRSVIMRSCSWNT